MESERDQLLALTRSRTVGAACVRRAKHLVLEDGESRDTVMSRLACDSRFISRWATAFSASGWRAWLRASLGVRRSSRWPSWKRVF